jgi:hypothetical protein
LPLVFVCQGRKYALKDNENRPGTTIALHHGGESSLAAEH